MVPEPVVMFMFKVLLLLLLLLLLLFSPLILSGCHLLFPCFRFSTPPTVADEAVELPPIVHLPAGIVPNFSTESSVLNDSKKKNSRASFEKDRTDDYPLEEDGKLYLTDVVARPIRRRRRSTTRRNKCGLLDIADLS